VGFATGGLGEDRESAQNRESGCDEHQRAAHVVTHSKPCPRRLEDDRPLLALSGSSHNARFRSLLSPSPSTARRERPAAAGRQTPHEPRRPRHRKGETLGFIKIVADAETRKILGAAILGTGGDEAIHGVIDVMHTGVTYDVLERAVPIHPTVSELIPTLLSEMQPDTT
jgi:hypothetical protein